jgi:hypothetical protein
MSDQYVAQTFAVPRAILIAGPPKAGCRPLHFTATTGAR